MTYISSLLVNNRKQVKVWYRDQDGERKVKLYDSPYYFYVEHPEGSDTDLFGRKLKKLTFDNPKDFFEAKKAFEEEDILMFESDIRPEYKILSQEFYGADIGDLNVTFFDIEVDYDPDIGFPSPENVYAPINSIALYHEYSKRTIVLAIPPSTRRSLTVDDLPDDIKDSAEIVLCDNEKELLKIFFKEIENSDILSGWNSDFFDIPYIYNRANVILHKKAGDKLCFIGSKSPTPRDVEQYGNINTKLILHGRISLDYLDVYKKFEMSEKGSYKLEHVADEELPDLPKLSYQGSLADLYVNDFEQFLRYNIRDTLILNGLEEKKKYIKLSIQMSHMATSQIPDVLGTIKVAEMSIINYCHNVLNKKVPDHHPEEATGQKYDGATVIDPQVGMHVWSGSVDLASLYPTTMRSLNISPETIVGEFLERHEAFKRIKEESDKEVTFKKENSDGIITATGKKWKRILRKQNWTVSAAGTVFHQDFDGVIPSILTTWFDERKQYKKKMYEADQAGNDVDREYFDNMQYIKKIQLNAMYGACGNRFFKFFDVRLAESTTLSGREVLYHMASKIAEELDGVYNMDSECIIYGDTDSVYFKTYQNDADSALATANEVCDAINASYPDFMAESFLCNDSHNSLMKAEQEIVSDRGIYIKKKYYILHLVYNDGAPVDKMKYMGVPIKKTTLPPEIKDKLSSFIERLLKGESWDIIGPEIVDFKDALYELNDITLLGSPTGVKSVETNTEIYNAKGEERKRIAGHCRASILWNACLKQYNDNESPRIISGSKIRVFQLKTPIDGFFNSIAIPKDADIIPEWFYEHFVSLIDKDAQIAKLVDEPMKVMITAAGIKVPTKKKLKFEEGLFE